MYPTAGSDFTIYETVLGCRDDLEDELSGSDAADELNDDLDAIEDADSDLEMLDETPAPKRRRAAQGALPVCPNSIPHVNFIYSCQLLKPSRKSHHSVACALHA